MAGHIVTGALMGHASIFHNLVAGEHEGNFFVVAFNELRQDGGPTTENWIRGFKSEDQGATWTQVGSRLRVLDQQFASCLDGRGGHILVSYVDINHNHAIARFNMELETFDLENHFLVDGRRASGAEIASNADGDIRILANEEPDFPAIPSRMMPYYLSLDGDTLAVGSPQTVPGIIAPVDQYNGYSGAAIAPAPASGGHPEGAQGWFYMLFQSEGDGMTNLDRFFIYDDTGARVELLNQIAHTGIRTAFRTRLGAPEPVALVHQYATSNYRSALLSNDSSATVVCDQGQVPTVTSQGAPLLTGGGALAGRGEDMYLLWFAGQALKASKASGALSSCSGWGAFEILLTVDETPVAMHGAASVESGIAVLYAGADISPSEFDSWFDVYFVLYPLGGGCPQPEVSTHECSDAPDADTEHSCGGDQKQGYAI